MQKKVTIKDIALKAGLSVGTVDRVLHKRGYVSDTARETVEKALTEMGYEPNLMASTLAYNRIIRFVALTPDPAADPYWEQPYNGIRQAAETLRHYNVQIEMVLFNLFEAPDFVAKANSILANPPDGLVFPPLLLKEGEWLLGQCAAAGIPVVNFNTQTEQQKPLSYIGQDSYQSGILAARLLDFALHEKETVMVLNLDKAITNARHIQEKERGFRQYFSALEKNDIQVVKYDFENFENQPALKQFLKEKFQEHPQLAGIFITNSRVHQLVHALPHRKHRHLRIVGFDLIAPNIALLAAGKVHFIINQNSVEQGYRSAVTLFNHLLKKENPDAEQYLPLDIVVAENVQYYLDKQRIPGTI